MFINKRDDEHETDV